MKERKGMDMRHFYKVSVFLVGICSLSACSDMFANEARSQTGEAEASTSVMMTPARMAEFVTSFDEDAQVGESNITFKVGERDVLIVHDAEAGRMRIMSPIAPATLLDEKLLMRMSQANFDAVLDARYAVADGLLWSTFIHPLGSLQQDDFISGIAQTVTAAETFGTTYSSGAIVFGGGDTSALHDELLKELEAASEKAGEPI